MIGSQQVTLVVWQGQDGCTKSVSIGKPTKCLCYTIIASRAPLEMVSKLAGVGYTVLSCLGHFCSADLSSNVAMFIISALTGTAAILHICC